MIEACSDDAGGAYFAWGHGAPVDEFLVGHVDAFGDDVFTNSSWTADTTIGEPLHLTSDRGALVVLSVPIPVNSTATTLLLSRIESAGARAWTARLWTGRWGGDWTGTRLATEPTGGVLVAWLDGAQAPFELRAQRVARDGGLSWGENGRVVASVANSIEIGAIEADGDGGLWLAYTIASAPADLRVQHVRADGSLAFPSPGAFVEHDVWTWQISSDAAGGLYVSYQNYPITARLQRVRADGSLAFGDHGIEPQHPPGSELDAPSLGAAADGHVFVAWQSREGSYVGARVQLMDSTGTWLWPSPLLAAKAPASGLGTRVYANPDGSATITVQPGMQIEKALSGAQRFATTGTMLWPDPPPTLIVLEEWEQASYSMFEPWCTAPTGDGGVMHFFTLADSGAGNSSGAYSVRAQHLDAYGRRGDTSPRIVAACDVPNDLGGWIEVRWAASCLEGDSTMATSGYDVLREQPDGTWTAVAHVAAAGVAEYMAQVPTLSDSTSSASPRTVVRVRASDAAARTWTSPSDSASSFANSPPLAVDAASARALVLDPPSPSPANATALLRFAVPERGRVTLHVYDASGRRVRRLVDAEYPAGPASTPFPLADDAGRTLAPGIYIVRLEAAGVSRSRRLVVLR